MKPEKISTGWWLITVIILFALLTRCAPAKTASLPLNPWQMYSQQFSGHPDSIYLMSERMKTETLSILQRVQNGELTPQVAQEQLFVLFGVSGCFTIGAKIQITKCIYGHEYEIGEVVTIIAHDETTFWLCRNVRGKEWYIDEEEGIPVNNH